MNDADPTDTKRPRWHSVVGVVLPIGALVLPLCLVLGGYSFVKHDRDSSGQVVVTDEEIIFVLLCSFLFLVLELVAFVFALRSRGTVLGNAALGLSGILLGLSALSFAYVLTIRLDRGNAGWLGGTPFWVIATGVLLAVSLVLFALFRAKWLLTGDVEGES